MDCAEALGLSSEREGAEQPNPATAPHGSIKIKTILECIEFIDSSFHFV
jgi:hypothetical protein